MKLVIKPDGSLALASPSRITPIKGGGRVGKAGKRRNVPRGGRSTDSHSGRSVRLPSVAMSTREQHFRLDQLRLILGMKLALLTVVSIVVLGLAASRPAAPKTRPVVDSVPELTASTYLHVETPVATLPQVVWLARVGQTAIAVVDDSWKKMQERERLALLRSVMALTGNPQEVLLLSRRSELWAEVYGKAYHLYA